MDWLTIKTILQAKGDIPNCQAFSKVLIDDEAMRISYANFTDLLPLLQYPNSYVRFRSFTMICQMAKMDVDSKIDANLVEILATLDDTKPIVVRVALGSLSSIFLNKPMLHDALITKLKAIDASKYADSMRPLIEKDIKQLLETYE